jgi:trk system potassium uptake protein TrkH
MVFEWNNLIKTMSPGEKIIASLFQSITCRTAGFNSVDIGLLRQSTLSVMMLLMFIGGSPGSIAGGIKITTFAVISGLIISRFKGQRQIVFWNRAIHEEAVNKSMMLVVISFILIYSSTILLLWTGSSGTGNSYLSVMFEVISAFGTVGLSTGITSGLPDMSKVFLSVVMFVGRVGVFAMLTALTSDTRDTGIEFADENIMIG